MKKKLMCFLLCASMMVGGLVGCKKDESTVADTEESERVAMTLSLWIPTNEGTTEEAIKAAEAAINKLTQAKYDTAIELHAIPHDEYQATIDAKMAEIEVKKEEEAKAAAEKRKKAKEEAAANKNNNSKKETEAPETVEVEETYVNDLGITVVKYPAVAATQMDIFLVQGYDNYMRYIDEELIQQLDSELNASSKILKTYIYEQFLQHAKVRGTYAIPNNHPVGEYEYLLVNKELVDTYYYDPSNLNSFLKCQDFIKDMAWQKNKGEAALEDVTIILGQIDAIHMNYWSVDGEWSLIGNQVTNYMTYSSKCAPKSVLSIQAYTNTIALMKEFTEAGYVGDGIIDEGEKFAVGVLKGDGTIVDQYSDDYYISIYGNPVMEQEDVFGNMFAVSSYSKNLARSMEIITYLNTSPDIRTILQYGAEGVHWQYNEENPDVIDIISDEYSMNLVETGNVYMTYPGEGIPMSYWNYGKQQNLDAITSPYLMFGDDYIVDENREKMEELAKLSATYKARIDAMTAEEFRTELSTIKEELKANELLTYLLEIDDKDEVSPAYLYDDFYSYNYD